ncbi:MAG: transposase [Candidatus Bathyarchaeota archaeon]|uniref:transposase n=1 Tax=Candidatus Bathycorpusculum sp. TaxID=2994959 RepID=UPI0028334987|nr:transposase [Candidatus Termiticorpusculum sp.]
MSLISYSTTLKGFALVRSIVRGLTIILDRASFYRRVKLKILARCHGMSIEFLPAYSPDFNPIEKDWVNMKNALVGSLSDYSDVTFAVYDYFKVNTS